MREIAGALRLSIREVGADGFEGALIRAKDLAMGAIVVRESIREAGRKNFTIAHEIGHFVLPSHDRVSLACTAAEVGDWSDVPAGRKFEREADEFAAELLMPASAVEAAGKDVMPSLRVIEKIAQVSGASLSAAAWRYCDLSAEKCAVVWSTDGAIQWVKRSAGFPFFLPREKPVRLGSFAAACFAGERVPSWPRSVSAHLWISATNPDTSVPMLEQSKALPSYRSVITLLWIGEEEEHR